MAQQKYKSEPVKEGQKKSNIKHQSFGTQALPPPKPTAITKTNKPMAQQTAVDWFAKQVEENLGWYPVDIIKQAKQMEREQIIKAHDDGDVWSGEKYYTQTYGK